MDFQKPRLPWATIVAFVCVTVVVVVALLRDRFVSPPYNQVTVAGQGKVQVKPDIAMVRLSVVTPRQPTSAQAFDKNVEIMNRVVDSMKKLSIDEKDLQSTGLRLNPVYEYKDGGPRLLGYEAYQELSVKVRDLKKLSEVVGRATGEGVNQLGTISFTVDEVEKYKAEARAKAVQAARLKAAELSSLTGMRLGKLINYFEGGAGEPPVPMYADGMGGGPVALKAEVMPRFEAGSEEIMVEVGLTYRVK